MARKKKPKTEEIVVPMSASRLKDALVDSVAQDRPRRKRAQTKEQYEAALATYDACKIQTVDEFINCVWGLPLYFNLPLQYLFRLNVIPFGRGIMLVGDEASGKTTLGIDILARCMFAGGLSYFIEVENKPNPHLVRDMVHDDEVLENRFIPMKGITTESVMTAVGNTIRKTAEINPARDVPMAFLIDSINALISEEERIKEESGTDQAGYQAMRNASVQRDMLRIKIMTYLRNNPVIFMATNHLTTSGGAAVQGTTVKGLGAGGGAGRPDAHIPGGKMWKYLTNWIITLRKQKDIIRGGLKFPTYTITNHRKASMGEKGAPKIHVTRFSSSVGTDGSELSGGKIDEKYGINLRERIWFDWDTALVDLLMQMPKASLAKVMDINVSGTKYGSSRLGPERTNPCLTEVEFGRAIHTTPDLVRDLQTHVFGIRVVKELVGYVESSPECSDEDEKPDDEEGTGGKNGTTLQESEKDV